MRVTNWCSKVLAAQHGLFFLGIGVPLCRISFFLSVSFLALQTIQQKFLCLPPFLFFPNCQDCRRHIFFFQTERGADRKGQIWAEFPHHPTTLNGPGAGLLSLFSPPCWCWMGRRGRGRANVDAAPGPESKVGEMFVRENGVGIWLETLSDFFFLPSLSLSSRITRDNFSAFSFHLSVSLDSLSKKKEGKTFFFLPDLSLFFSTFCREGRGAKGKKPFMKKEKGWSLSFRQEF